ncbi:hypothetical protein Ddye_031610 [Dipteronia dyeriana]|uniref:Uncharacterized protein n=1 Tax=Dipteronia dyeriana TaxID=168575 RepID=A0AAD9TJM9_9ROSI|nr:hypothetical protein Ddye_031610 [Dipteronia dyeriana]
MRIEKFSLCLDEKLSLHIQLCELGRYTTMLKTLERYQKCNYGAPEPNVSAREALVKFVKTLACS